MQRLLLLGLNHTTAPLDVRERLAFNAEQQRQALEKLKVRFPECEFALVSTCNRVELYLARPVHGHPRTEEVTAFLSEFHGVPQQAFETHLYERSDRDVVNHLFSVSASLDSMVIGETQIIGQVRQAYEVASSVKTAGSILNPLFQRAIAVGKDVMSTTQLGDGRVSVAGVAVGYARRIFDHFGDKTILCVGAGKMAVLALRGFKALNPGRLIVCTRNPEKADRVAAEFGGAGAPFTELDSQLVAADIVITSTGATEPIITRERFAALLKQRRYRPIFIIDIAVPRDVEPGVGELDHVYLYNLDDLQKAIHQTHAQRGGVVEAARMIVDRHVNEFVASQRQRELGPAIEMLYKRLHEIAADEVQRTLARLPSAGEQEKAHLEELARRIVNKVLHDPVRMLREGDRMHGSAGQYLHAIQQIFGLNEGSDDASQQPGRNGDAD